MQIAFAAIGAVVAFGIQKLLSEVIFKKDPIRFDSPYKENLDEFLNILTTDFARKTEDAIRQGFIDHSFEDIKTDTAAAARMYALFLQSVEFNPGQIDLNCFHEARHDITQARERLVPQCVRLLQEVKAEEDEGIKIRNKVSRIKATLYALESVGTLDAIILGKMMESIPNAIQEFNRSMNEYIKYSTEISLLYYNIQPFRFSVGERPLHHAMPYFEFDGNKLEGKGFEGEVLEEELISKHDDYYKNIKIPLREEERKWPWLKPNSIIDEYRLRIGPKLQRLAASTLCSTVNKVVEIWKELQWNTNIAYLSFVMQTGNQNFNANCIENIVKSLDSKNKGECLIVAAETGNINFFRYLLRANLGEQADINFHAEIGYKHPATTWSKSVVHSVAQYGSLGMLQILLERQADLSIINKNGENVLHSAARNRDIEIFMNLLNRVQDPFCLNFAGKTILHVAVHSNNVALVGRILQLVHDPLKHCTGPFSLANELQHIECRRTISNFIFDSQRNTPELLFNKRYYFYFFEDIAIERLLERDAATGDSLLHKQIRGGQGGLEYFNFVILPLIEHFIKNGINVLMVNIEGKTPLDLAIDLGYKFRGLDVNMLFLEAAKRCNIPSMRHYLAAGANINAIDYGNINALHFVKRALQPKEIQLQTINFLLGQGINFLYQSSSYKFTVADEANQDIVERIDVFAKKNPDVANVFSNQPQGSYCSYCLLHQLYPDWIHPQIQETALHKAVRINLPEAVKHLVENHEIDPTSVNQHGQTALQLSEILNRPDCAEFIKSKKLALAIQNGLLDEVQELIEAGANLAFRYNRTFSTLLDIAAVSNSDQSENILRLLLGRGNFTPQDLTLARDSAAFAERHNLVRIINQSLNLIGDPAIDENLLFFRAVCRGDIRAAINFINRHHVNVNHVNVITGKTALNIALEQGNCPMIQLLLENNIDNFIEMAYTFPDTDKRKIRIKELPVVSQGQIGQQTGKVLLQAYKNRDFPRFNKILKFSCADINSKDPENNRTILHIAVERNSLKDVESCTKYGADCLIMDNQGISPLQMAKNLNAEQIQAVFQKQLNDRFLEAVRSGKADQAAELLKQGANINSKNSYSALQEAVRYESGVPMVNLLLERNINVNFTQETVRRVVSLISNTNPYARQIQNYINQQNEALNNRKINNFFGLNSKHLAIFAIFFAIIYLNRSTG